MSDELRAAEQKYNSLNSCLNDTIESANEKWHVRKECFMSASFNLRHSGSEMTTIEEIKSKVHKTWRSELPALEDALSGLPETFRPAKAVNTIEAYLAAMKVATGNIVDELRHEVAEAKKKVEEAKKNGQ